MPLKLSFFFQMCILNTVHPPSPLAKLIITFHKIDYSDISDENSITFRFLRQDYP